MPHFTIEQWTDFARNLVAGDAAEKMKEHLASECPKCIEAFGTMSWIVGVAAREANYEPPVDIVRSAKMLPNAHASEGVRSPVREFMQLAFDSFAQPVLAGVRGTRATSRHLLYRKGDCCIDMTLEPTPGAKQLILLGQILDSSRPDRNGGSILVELMSGGKVIAGAATTSHGEFQFLFSPANELQLCIGFSSQNCFWIKIPPLETIPESGLVVGDSQ